MARGYFFNVPAYGHLNPTLPLTAELVRRGDHIVYYDMEPFRESIEATGAEFRAYETLSARIAATFNAEILQAPTLAELAATVTESSEVLLPPLMDVAQRESPDYVIRDLMALWGRYLGRHLQIPTAETIGIFPLKPKGSMRPPIGLLLEMLGALPKDIPAYLRFWRSARRLKRTYGGDRLGLANIFVNAEDCTIAFTSRRFHPHGDAFDDRFVFVGPSISERSEAPSLDLDRLKPPLVYVSLGTVYNTAPGFFRACFAAFADTPVTVITAVGKHITIGDLAPIPDNVIALEFVPQLEILRRADLFITHGGMNSVNEGLYFGVPLIVIPQAVDQFFVAQAVRELGAGYVLAKRTITSATLKQATLRALKDDSLHKRVQTVAASLREAGGYRRAADAIMAYTR